ncbi:endonuclease/exonuclease/phosphatase family protein [Parenemella sanctibonifatiensis]|uniref:Endonuclease/exonuclease/phosphatase domain-containing protein n=1 Tax=Parenemella sanctibonifatiensis TaxID=2016505 RepID=A0A255E0R1_9ACTN|nr:endonuclease/exonuclease/phosphatase family protein [Parenemella sanctibonifatiensis]OYN85124.1 hypothetical protein CGZ92_11730 [Parenemella sanctibonifatiensis]
MPRPRPFTTAVGVLLLVIGAAAALPLWVMWLAPRTQLVHTYAVYAASFIPYVALPTLVALLGLVLLARRLWRWVATGVLLFALICFGLPLLGTFPDDPGPAGDLQFLSINAQFGQVEVTDIEALVEPGTDIVAITEYTPELERRIADSDFGREFPHRVGEARPGADGTAVYAREPISLIDQHNGWAVNLLVQPTAQDGIDYTVAVVHPVAPTVGPDRWDADAHGIAAWLRPHVQPRFVAIGDFNAAREHVTMGYFRDIGLTDPQFSLTLGRSMLAKWQPTWPVGAKVPPFVRIDHVLVPQHSTFASNRYRDLPGSDHRAVLGGIFPGR